MCYCIVFFEFLDCVYSTQNVFFWRYCCWVIVFNSWYGIRNCILIYCLIRQPLLLLKMCFITANKVCNECCCCFKHYHNFQTDNFHCALKQRFIIDEVLKLNNMNTYYVTAIQLLKLDCDANAVCVLQEWMDEHFQPYRKQTTRGQVQQEVETLNAMQFQYKCTKTIAKMTLQSRHTQRPFYKSWMFNSIFTK